MSIVKYESTRILSQCSMMYCDSFFSLILNNNLHRDTIVAFHERTSIKNQIKIMCNR